MSPQKSQRLPLTASAGQPSIFSGNLKANQKNKPESRTGTWGRKCVIPAWLVPLTQQGCSAPLILAVRWQVGNWLLPARGEPEPLGLDSSKERSLTWSFVASI